MAVITSCIAFIDRNHHETTFGCIDVFRWAIFHLVTVSWFSFLRSQQRQTATTMTMKGRKKRRFINQLKIIRETQKVFPFLIPRWGINYRRGRGCFCWRYWTTKQASSGESRHGGKRSNQAIIQHHLPSFIFRIMIP